MAEEARNEQLGLVEQLKASFPEADVSSFASGFLGRFEQNQADSITCWRADSVERRPGSKIEGEGLFAVSDIKKGEVIAIKPGRVINTQQVLENEDVIRGSHQQIGPDEFLAGLTPDEVDRNLVGYNHSCLPNAKVLVIPDVKLAFLMAKEDIKEGEITADYSVSQASNTHRIFECNCGNGKRCRKFIQPGTDWLQKDFQEANRYDFPWFIKKGIMLLWILPPKEIEEFLRFTDSLRVAGKVHLLASKILRKEKEFSRRSFLVRQFKRQYGPDSTLSLILELRDQISRFAKLVGPEILVKLGIDKNDPRSILTNLEEIGKAAVAIDREATETNFLMSIFHPVVA